MKNRKNAFLFLVDSRIVTQVLMVIFLGGAIVNAQTTNSFCIVDVSKPGAEVAPICRGQQIEEFNHQFQGGLYAQLINNPSFDELE